MARNTGPTDRIARRYGVALFGPSKALERRPYPPGQHGARGARRKHSDYSVALAEKQKLRLQYGLMEKQFRRYFAEAQRRRGITGDILVQLLRPVSTTFVTDLVLVIRVALPVSLWVTATCW